MSLYPVFTYFVIIVSAIFHEYAHGLMAYELGDDTAKRAGRLTLNPIPHLDPFGTIILPLFLLFSSGIFIGWAKPVPYNPHNLSDKKFGSLKVALAGPAANLSIAVIFSLFIRFIAPFIVSYGLLSANAIFFLELVVYTNIVLAVFNLIPIPPLDGSEIVAVLFPKYFRYFLKLGFAGIFIALLVAFIFIPSISETIFYILIGSSLVF
ncbi:MAG: site-2 protease family protein [Candidatus Pacebacteria bacterium]|nr:site-2 protease family protein [Candidatus Paceibacterota bacterium]